MESHNVNTHEYILYMNTVINTEQLKRLPAYVEDCYSATPSLLSLQRIRKLGMNGLLTQEIIETGVVSRLVELLDSSSYETEIVYEAAWILTNIVAGTTNQTAVVINHGGHKKLLQLMHRTNLNENVIHTSVEALGNIAGDCSEYRDELLSCNILNYLLPLCNPMQSAKILRSATWTLSGLCRTHPQPKWQYIVQILKGLSMLLFFEDGEVLCNVCWAYSHLLRDVDLSCDVIVDNSQSQQVIIDNYRQKCNVERRYFAKTLKDMEKDLKLAIPSDVVGECYRFYALFSEKKVESFDNNVIKQMISLLGYPDRNVQHSAIVAFGNMQRYMMSEQIQAIENEHGLMSKLYGLLESPEKNIRRDCCWVISNIIVTIPQPSHFVIDSNILLKIIFIVQNDAHDVALEAIWAVANSINKYGPYIVEHNIVNSLFAFLHKINDTKTLQFIMDIIGNILRFKNNDALSLQIYQQMKSVKAVQCIKTWTEKNTEQIDHIVRMDINATLNKIEQFMMQCDSQLL
eukprot:246607_1